jgi:hypothetical protein
MKLNLDFSEIEELDFDRSYNLKEEKEHNLDAVVLVSESLGHHRVDSQLFNTYLGSIPLE